jgi:positive regulator of sigma E activity
MKKSDLITGLISLLVGITCLVSALLFETKLNSILSGFAGAGISSGAVILWKYYYWSKPENRSKYKEKIENENIELHDERKEMLRDKSGRYAYILGLIILSISIVVFSILGSLEITGDNRLIVIYLGGFLVFQYVIGIIIYKRLSKKY